jgi:hypothetical protein
LTFLFALGYRSDKQEAEEIINTESIRMLDCDGHVIESMSELAEYGDAWIRWLTPGQKVPDRKTSDGSRFLDERFTQTTGVATWAALETF